MTTIIIILLLVCGAIFLLLTFFKPKASASGIVAKPVLTDNEREFFTRLQRALPDCHIFPQVSANAILRVQQTASKRDYHSTRNRFAQKHVDFVVCELKTLQIIAIIELDDKTHSAKKDSARDALFTTAGYRVIRFQSKRKPSEGEIAALVLGTRANAQQEESHTAASPPASIATPEPTIASAEAHRAETTW